MSFSLTRKTDYGLVALAKLAAEAAGGGQPLSARQIAEAYNLPLPLLMNVLKDLHRAGIVCSRRGAAGGYHLCKDPASISLLGIIEAIEGPVHAAVCCSEEELAGGEPCAACRVQPRCPITTPMQRLDERVREFLARLSLRDVIADSPIQITRSPAAAASAPALSGAREERP